MFTIINRYLNFMNGGILMKFKEWDGFVNGDWQSEIDVRDFIQKNYTPYTGDDSFLSEATNTTKKLWDEVLALYKRN